MAGFQEHRRVLANLHSDFACEVGAEPARFTTTHPNRLLVCPEMPMNDANAIFTRWMARLGQYSYHVLAAWLQAGGMLALCAAVVFRVAAC